MNYSNIEVKEQLVKRAMAFGNGSIVFTPKAWRGREVIVILPKRSLSVEESALQLIQPSLKNIVGAFFVGSYARNEMEKDSDVDLIIVSDKKMKIKEKENFHVQCIELQQLKNSLKENPIEFYPMLLEAKSLINEKLLQELKETEINFKKFNWFIETTESALKVVRELIKMEKTEGKKFSDSTASVYSLILRLRGIYLIKCILNKRPYSNKSFKEFIKKESGIKENSVKQFYEVYRKERDEKKAKALISIEELEKLFYFAQKKLMELKEKLHERQEKTKEEH
ncbi:MAG: nucleotidyltransferase domain-containing protein [Candidatus Diapherotrites archaeon]